MTISMGVPVGENMLSQGTETDLLALVKQAFANIGVCKQFLQRDELIVDRKSLVVRSED